MGLFEIKVTNRKTGEVMQFSADVFALSAAEITKDGVLGISSGIEDPETMAKAAMGADYAKENLLAQNLFAKMMYHCADLFFDEEDIGAIRRDGRNRTSE